MVNKLEIIKKDLESITGSRVKVTTKEGRKKLSIRRGVIEKTYPSVFVVKFDTVYDDVEIGRCSYSYTDVLTHNIELTVFKNTTA